MSVFDWIQFNEGSARYSGIVRGCDEVGHDTFAIKIGEAIYYGEAKRSWLSDGKSYNVEILSFGYGAKSELGIPLTHTNPLIGQFSKKDINKLESIICQLVEHFSRSTNDKPTFLGDIGGARFTGEIAFNEDWVILNNNIDGAAL